MWLPAAWHKRKAKGRGASEINGLLGGEKEGPADAACGGAAGHDGMSEPGLGQRAAPSRQPAYAGAALARGNDGPFCSFRRFCFFFLCLLCLHLITAGPRRRRARRRQQRLSRSFRPLRYAQTSRGRQDPRARRQRAHLRCGGL